VAWVVGEGRVEKLGECIVNCMDDVTLDSINGGSEWEEV
jgi:hypothetical protein